MSSTQVDDRLGDGFEERLLPMLREAVEAQRAAARVASKEEPAAAMPPIARRPRSRARWRRRAAIVALAAVLGAVLVWGPGPRATGHADSIDVSAAQAAGDPAAVEAQLRSQGVDARIIVVPFDPVMADRWFHVFLPPGAGVDIHDWALLQAQTGNGVEALGPLPATLQQTVTGVAHEPVLSLPNGFTGPVTLVVSREVQPGDARWSREFDALNELAPTGLFYCLDLTSMTPAQAGARLAGLGYQVKWYVSTDAGNAEGLAGQSAVVDAPPPGTGLVDADLESPNTVDLGLWADADVPSRRASAGTPDPSEPPVPSWAPDCGSDWAPFMPIP